MKYGYVRDSLGVEQHIEKQKQMIGEVDTLVIDTDKSKLKELLENVKSGDSIHISDMNRITRKIEECSRLYEYLSNMGVKLYVNGTEYKPLSDFMKNLLTSFKEN